MHSHHLRFCTHPEAGTGGSRGPAQPFEYQALISISTAATLLLGH